MRLQVQFTSEERDAIAARMLDADGAVIESGIGPASDPANRHSRFIGGLVAQGLLIVADPPVGGATLFEGVPITEVSS